MSELITLAGLILRQYFSSVFVFTFSIQLSPGRVLLPRCARCVNVFVEDQSRLAAHAIKICVVRLAIFRLSRNCDLKIT